MLEVALHVLEVLMLEVRVEADALNEVSVTNSPNYRSDINAVSLILQLEVVGYE